MSILTIVRLLYFMIMLTDGTGQKVIYVLRIGVEQRYVRAKTTHIRQPPTEMRASANFTPLKACPQNSV